jgi:hypothetical protein
MDTNKSNLFEIVMALTREEEEEARGRRHNGVARNEVGHEGAPEIDIGIGQREREEEDQNAVEERARGGRQADHPVSNHLEQEDLHEGPRSDERRDQRTPSISPSCLVTRSFEWRASGQAGKKAGVSRDAVKAGLKVGLKVGVGLARPPLHRAVHRNNCRFQCRLEIPVCQISEVGLVLVMTPTNPHAQFNGA